MQPVLAFDVYGTLIDTLGVTIELERRLSDCEGRRKEQERTLSAANAAAPG